MSVVPLSLDSKLEPRALLNCVLRDGDIVGTNDAGRTALLLMLDPWTLHRLLVFDADAADLEDTDGEPEPDQEFDAQPPCSTSCRPSGSFEHRASRR